MTFGALAILNPWLLAALASLPVIYWLLRTVPPRPRHVDFPPTRILVGLETKEKTPAKTPWWLMLIRLLAAALVILALSEPILNPSQSAAVAGRGPLVVAIDNGWAAAARWPERQRLVDLIISEAESQNRPVALLPTAATSKTPTVRIEAPADARASAAALVPQPFAPDRPAALKALTDGIAAAGAQDLGAVWLVDGIDHDGKAAAFVAGLRAVTTAGDLTVIEDRPSAGALALKAGLSSNGRLTGTVLASHTPRDVTLHAYSAQGARLGEAPVRAKAGEQAATGEFALPLELRNQVTRVEIAGERSAGAVALLDATSQWHRIGLISGENREQAQPLLAPLYYIQKALAPFAELVQPKDANLGSGVNAALSQNASVLVMADIGTLQGDAAKRIEEWVGKGGVLLRFAGPRLEKGGDELLPVELRLGGRTLGGALSWSTPQPLAAFETGSPFAGLDIPKDVTIKRQVLADPARLGPDVQVWARLQDGTPLVTARQLGQGHLVLFHVTANSDWSSLPMSGLFVDMLRRVAALGRSGGVGETANASADSSDQSAPQPAAETLAAVQNLDGFGVLRPPPPTAQAIPAAKLAELRPSLDHPPGYYGPAGSPRVLNVIGANVSALAPIGSYPAGVTRRGYDSETAQPLKPSLLALALALFLVDVAAVLLLQSGGVLLSRLAPRRAAATAVLAGFAILATPNDPASAQSREAQARPPQRAANLPPIDASALAATSKVTLGFVKTGNADADQTSRLGLIGLNKVLALRTAVEPGEPIEVDIARDEIAFYPVLYWPVLPDAQPLGEEAVAKIDAYMKQGGLIIFDTRDYGQGAPSGLSQPGRQGAPLQRLLSRLDLPRLEPVPETHVLTKAFYLLRYFPGRWDGGQLWVEATAEDDGEADGDESRKARRADGVTSVMITSNDFAAAWALDDRGRPLFPVVPGGEVQREMSFRTGINIVMHALTGNYKADQVHVPALLERLGQ